jgi:general secretion pathway protein F
MALYAVRALRQDGGEEVARIDAASEALAAAVAQSRGLIPIDVSPAAAPRAARPNKRARSLATRVARELSILIQAGLSIEPALAALSRHAAERELKAAAQGLLADVRQGKSLSEAFAARAELFPAPFPEIAEAGEAGGALGKALGELAETRERREVMEAAVGGAMVYPAFLLGFALIAIGAILVFVVPSFEQLFIDMGAEPPAQAAFVFAIADGVATYGPFVLVGLVVAVLAWRAALARPAARARWDRWVLSLPLAGDAVRTVIAARFCRVLALLLENGLSAAPALRLASRAAGNSWAVKRLNDALSEVRAGRSFSERMEASDVLPPLAAELLQVGEETGELAPAAKRLATYYETRFERVSKQIVRLIEPAVIILTGVAIGLMIVSILSALVSLNEVVY